MAAKEGNIGRKFVKFKTLIVAAAGLAVALAFGPSAKADKMELAKFAVKDGGIAMSLTGKKGDAKSGRKLAINRKKGNCLACHVMPIPEQPYHGKIGPDLNGVAKRYSEAELRLRVVDSKAINKDSFMPAFYKNTGFHRVMKKWKGKTILSAQEVEDIVAYLETLK